MLKFLSPAGRQLTAAKGLLAHLAETCDIPASVRLWDGSCVPLGQRAAETGVTIAIRGPGVIGALLRWPTLDHFIRQYATGGIDFCGADLVTVGETLRSGVRRPKFRDLSKSRLFRALLPFLFAPADQGDVQHGYSGDAEGRTAHREDKDYIQFHYDLGNDFYKLLLDREMVYSCGYFTDADQSLDQAQQDKLEMICRKLRLAPGEKLLDIGCGWGGLVCYAAEHYGVEAHGVTLSRAQYDFARAKIARLNLEGRVTVELKDYREVEGTYDKIASIGMFEHVGIAHMPAYFAKLSSLLRDRGILLNHGISRRAKAVSRKFHKRRPENRLMTRYIFPGAELDHIGHTLETMEASKLEVHDVEGWREHYMRTTAHWCRRLTENREEAIRQVGAERYRLWVAYLAGVSFAFRDGSLQIFQVVASKHSAKGTSELPPTRADLYAPPAKPALRAA